jgi:hypothetical protein
MRATLFCRSSAVEASVRLKLFNKTQCARIGCWLHNSGCGRNYLFGDKSRKSHYRYSYATQARVLYSENAWSECSNQDHTYLLLPQKIECFDMKRADLVFS